MITQPPMTEEQATLFMLLAQEMPGIEFLPWESVAIDVVGDKRVLCLQAPWQEGQRDLIYLHFHPEGVTEVEATAIAAGHGHDSVDWVGP